MEQLGVTIPVLDNLITVLGTIGLVLIVLEASLEIQITKSNKLIFIKSFASALLIISITSFFIYFVLDLFFSMNGKNIALASVALSIISSAIVIPSVANVNKEKKLFLTLESAFSDFIGGYAVEICIMLFFAILAVFFLGIIMKVNTSKIRYFIILAIILLVYGVAKYLNLSALILVLLFGLSLANFEQIKALPRIQ